MLLKFKNQDGIDRKENQTDTETYMNEYMDYSVVYDKKGESLNDGN